MLDLGVWTALHALVEKTHYMHIYNVPSLIKSIHKTWFIGKLNGIISKVFLRLKKAL